MGKASNDLQPPRGIPDPLAIYENRSSKENDATDDSGHGTKCCFISRLVDPRIRIE